MNDDSAPAAPPIRSRGIRAVLWGLALLPWAAAVLALAWAGLHFSGEDTPAFDDPAEHFKYGSIGGEGAAGIPYWLWKALPAVFDEETGRIGYYQFGMIFELDAEGNDRELPVGLARREHSGVEMVWFNCAACHTGSYRERKESPRVVVPGMPANTFDMQALLRFLFDAAVDERFNPERLLAAMELVGADLGPLDRFAYRHFLIPQARERLLRLRSRLLPLMARQPVWGQGRSDLINTARVTLLGRVATTLTPDEALATADFTALWMQAPRAAMNLHWDGNNKSLDERNLFAAMALGIPEDALDRDALARVKEYLNALHPPSNPHLERLEPALMTRGRALFMEQCAACHGHWEGTYVFEAEQLGSIEPLEQTGTDPARFHAFTESLADELNALPPDSERKLFKSFRKTRGYANRPLDGLWLRAPYLHNGSVPTLKDLLAPPAERPQQFFRGNNMLDFEDGGFLAGPCNPGTTYQFFFCFDTTAPGNGNGGPLYGTALPAEDKRALLTYLLAF
jgi:hypothetical protein